MKNPNGYGSVVKLSGNRRKPYCARKTAGWNEKGYPIYKAIGYHTTRQEAMMALAEYNRNPFDIDFAKITMKELFDKWSERDFGKISVSAVNAHRASFKHANLLHNIPYKNIKAYQMQEVIDHCGHGHATQAAIKNLFWNLDKYALELDIITKCYSNLIRITPTPQSVKRPFSEEEIKAIWALKNEYFMDTVLILLYTGFRISELLDMETAKINLQDAYFKGGTKTKAGKNRIVPIHPLILNMVKKRIQNNNTYLITYNNKRIAKRTYYETWNSLMNKLNFHHTPHECRHTFRSRLDSAGANKVCIDLLMGHKSKDIGERIYTHKTIEELRSTICLLD